MIALRGRSEWVDLARPLNQRLWPLAAPSGDPQEVRGSRACVVDGDCAAPAGYGLYLTKAGSTVTPAQGRSIGLPLDLGHLGTGDIVDVSEDGRRLAVLWRSQARVNSILLTERCDNYCVMCSQPPRDVDDSWLLDRARQLIELLPRDTPGFVITGGEPTLYGAEFTDLLRLVRDRLPVAEVHILTNGRRFADDTFAIDYASVGSTQNMVGIPLYGAEPSLHDEVVQAQGAFAETVQGILNLARLGQHVEIRTVLQRATADHIVDIAEYIARNLPFVDQVALMGLETIGFARRNLPEVWVDPWDYRLGLTEAAELLEAAGIHTLIYNHQLCTLESEARRFAVKSISDWKNEYDEVCDPCTLLAECGGFFHSAMHRASSHIAPIGVATSAMPTRPNRLVPTRQPRDGEVFVALTSRR